MFEQRHPFASLLTVAIVLGIIFWFIGGSRVKDLAPYYFKRVLGQTAIVEIKDATIKVEVAQTVRAREKGLSGRDYLEVNKGMIFIFLEEGVYPFTMAKTPIYLDIIWIKDGRIVFITAQAKPGQDIINPGTAADSVLELRAGQANAWGIGDEVRVTFERSIFNF